MMNMEAMVNGKEQDRAQLNTALDWLYEAVNQEYDDIDPLTKRALLIEAVYHFMDEYEETVERIDDAFEYEKGRVLEELEEEAEGEKLEAYKAFFLNLEDL